MRGAACALRVSAQQSHVHTPPPPPSSASPSRADFEGVSFLSNTATAVLLEALAATKYKQTGVRMPE